MLDEYVTCERCAAVKNLDPCDRGNDPAQDYAEEKCIGEGGHFWPHCDEPDCSPEMSKVANKVCLMDVQPGDRTYGVTFLGRAQLDDNHVCVSMSRREFRVRAKFDDHDGAYYHGLGGEMIELVNV